MDDMKRQYKSGSVRERGGRFYIRYYDELGKQNEESAGTDETAAHKLLRQRIGEVAAGTLHRKASSDVTVKECLSLAVADMKRRGLASERIAGWKVNSILGPAIGWKRASAFTWSDGWTYIESRRKDGVKDSTINRELSLLRSAFALAARPDHALLSAAPKIPHLDEGDNVRTGFLSPAEYAKMRDALPNELRPLICVAYFTGLRRGTLLALKLNQVDLDQGLIWVKRSQTKNRTSQTAPIIDGEMRKACAAAVANNREYLFERDGKPIRSFKAAWEIARAEAGLPNLNFHDLRRTAVRDWIAAGAPESTAMAISGHKTASILQRYNIIDAAVVKRAASLRAAEIPEAPAEQLRGNQKKKKGERPS